jgi:hypothetical protein
MELGISDGEPKFGQKTAMYRMKEELDQMTSRLNGLILICFLRFKLKNLTCS